MRDRGPYRCARLLLCRARSRPADRASVPSWTSSPWAFGVVGQAGRALAGRKNPRDAFRRETFALPREAAREKAREMFRRFPKAAYMTEIESWRELPGDRIEFTMRRLPSAD